MGTYTPNYNLYMPSIGEQGWGELVSNNFEILDTILNTINTNIGDGTRILSISSPPPITINTSNFNNYASYDENNVYYGYFNGNTTFESIPQPSYSCRLMIIDVNGDTTISGSLDTYPTALLTETPPDSPSNNSYIKEIIFSNFNSCTLTYTANKNNSQLIMNYNDYLTFLGKGYILLIPAATAAGGVGRGSHGTAGTASNTCNGGGGGGVVNYGDGNIDCTGGTGCIFGQYAGGYKDNNYNGYGYGSSASNKYRCGLVIIVNGNLTINESCAITQIGGNYNRDIGSYGMGGYGGGAYNAGGGGAPVFIYYTGTYVNNGTINTAGGNGYIDDVDGGAGGIKVTKISI